MDILKLNCDLIHVVNLVRRRRLRQCLLGLAGKNCVDDLFDRVIYGQQ